MCSDEAKRIFESLKTEPEKPMTSNQFSRIGTKEIMKAYGEDTLTRFGTANKYGNRSKSNNATSRPQR